MRILGLENIITHLSPAYQQHFTQTATQYEITMVTLFQSKITPDPRIHLLDGTGSLWQCMKHIRMALQAGPYDVIHLDAPYVGILFLLATAFNRRLRRRAIYTIRSSIPNYRLKHRIPLFFCLLSFRWLVACSQASYDSFQGIWRAAAGKRLIPIPNGVNLDRVEAAIAQLPPRQPNDSFTVVMVGRLVEVKNTVTGLRAFARANIPNSRMIVVGDGGLRETLEAEAQQLGIADRVTFAGLVARDEVFGYMYRGDVFLSTSLVEGMPVAVLEALACGTAAILSDIPSHHEISADNTFIPLIAPTDVDRYARTLSEYAQMSFEQRQTLGQAAQTWVQTHFSLKGMLAKYDELYRRTMTEANQAEGRN